MEKTNVMRILDQKKIRYEMFDYENSGLIAGADVAAFLGEDPAKVFKTLVTVSGKKTNYVFMVPTDKELDLKKAAACVNEKSIEMVRSKDLLPLTGYIHGGCSPIGMKKQFRTVIDESAKMQDGIYFSGGRIGKQVRVKVSDLEKVITLNYGDITK